MPKYCLTFSGEITTGSIIAEVKNNFKKKFNLTEVQLEHVFSGKTIILKKDLTQQEILLFATIIDEIGGICYIEAMEKANQLPPSITRDRRFSQRRKNINDRRRNLRNGIFSERRFKHDRRKDL